MYSISSNARLFVTTRRKDTPLNHAASAANWQHDLLFVGGLLTMLFVGWYVSTGRKVVPPDDFLVLCAKRAKHADLEEWIGQHMDPHTMVRFTCATKQHRELALDAIELFSDEVRKFLIYEVINLVEADPVRAYDRIGRYLIRIQILIIQVGRSKVKEIGLGDQRFIAQVEEIREDITVAV